jgi:hypothetical protein
MYARYQAGRALSHGREPVEKAKKKWEKNGPFQGPSICHHRRDVQMAERMLYNIGMFTFYAFMMN